MYNYGLIGNCQISAHISDKGSIDWLCMPRPDSPPVFGRILDPDGGHFVVAPQTPFTTRQTYLTHSNILVTHFLMDDGSEFRILDFCPRFVQNGRSFHPSSTYRIVERVKGECRIKISCHPVKGWTKERVRPSQSSSHLTWEMNSDSLRLYTNMSLTHLVEESTFLLNDKLFFALTWNKTIEGDLERISLDYLNETEKYWNGWVKHCSIPTLFQEQTIRSALVLKLHCYEDTGAILAALTTSLPEEFGGIRNWDYRFCWLRDSYFVLSALTALGHFEEIENFLKFLFNVVAQAKAENKGLAPVYNLDHQPPANETSHPHWAGFKDSRPVRTDNQAAEHTQHDVYGETILALAPIFFDARFLHFRDHNHESLLETLTLWCSECIAQPDAGLWELRDGWQEHTFTNLTCWAGLERAQRLQQMGFLKNLKLNLDSELARAQQAVDRAIVDNILRNSPKDPTLDASLLLTPIFRYPNKTLCETTVLAIKKNLDFVEGNDPSGFLFRYKRTDDFGKPSSAFLICGFWLAQALAQIGRREEGHKVLVNLQKSANHLSLFAEHYNPEIHVQSGNFPQAYSHVGQINAAFAISPSWSEVL